MNLTRYRSAARRGLLGPEDDTARAAHRFHVRRQMAGGVLI
jgi:hypothetical protein